MLLLLLLLLLLLGECQSVLGGAAGCCCLTPGTKMGEAADTAAERGPTAMDDYLFDLRGYLILKGALSKAHVASLNAGIDEYTGLEPGEWSGWVQRAPPTQTKRELHNLYVRPRLYVQPDQPAIDANLVEFSLPPSFSSFKSGAGSSLTGWPI